MITVTQKKCSRCRLVKPAEFFPRKRSSPDGLYCYCRECNRQRCAEKRQSKAFRERSIEYRSNPEVKARQREARRRFQENRKAEIAAFCRTPLGRAKSNLYRYRWLLKKEKGRERREEIKANIDFYEQEVERLS